MRSLLLTTALAALLSLGRPGATEAQTVIWYSNGPAYSYSSAPPPVIYGYPAYATYSYPVYGYPIYAYPAYSYPTYPALSYPAYGGLSVGFGYFPRGQWGGHYGGWGGHYGGNHGAWGGGHR